LKPARILGCRVLLIPILGLVSCYYSEAQQACEVDIIQESQNTCAVKVKPPCTTTSDPTVPMVDPDNGDTVIWNTLGYTISFKPIAVLGATFQHTPFTSPTFPSGPPPRPVKRDFWCNSLLRKCYFNYGLKQGTQTCADPGVQVVPPSPISFFIWLVALLGISSYAILRIRLRKRT
jgi:hypothetical protein